MCFLQSLLAVQIVWGGATRTASLPTGWMSSMAQLAASTNLDCYSVFAGAEARAMPENPAIVDI